MFKDLSGGQTNYDPQEEINIRKEDEKLSEEVERVVGETEYEIRKGEIPLDWETKFEENWEDKWWKGDKHYDFRIGKEVGQFIQEVRKQVIKEISEKIQKKIEKNKREDYYWGLEDVINILKSLEK